MMMACPICWKRFFGQPEFWPYRRGDYYLCSENCMIVFDVREFKEKAGWIDDHYLKKEEKKVHKITLAQKKKAVEIAIGGGNPLKYLEECGSGNPSAHWHYIKKTLKEKDPQKYAMIPERLDAKNEELKAVTCCAPSTREGVEVPDELPENEEHDVAMDDDFEIYGLKTGAGDFQSAAGNLCWTFDGYQMNLPVERWRQLIKTVPKVLNVMKL